MDKVEALRIVLKLAEQNIMPERLGQMNPQLTLERNQQIEAVEAVKDLARDLGVPVDD